MYGNKECTHNRAQFLEHKKTDVKHMKKTETGDLIWRKKTNSKISHANSYKNQTPVDDISLRKEKKIEKGSQTKLESLEECQMIIITEKITRKQWKQE